MLLSLWRSRGDAGLPGSALRRERAPMAAALTPYPPDEFVRLVFLGDLCGNGLAPDIDASIVGVLQSADLVIANCDAPVVRRPHLRMRSWLGRRRHMDAGTLLGLIAAMGIEPSRLILSVANDCALDQSVAGFEETLETLESLHVGIIGAARHGLVQRFAIGHVTVGLLAFSELRRGPRGRFRRRVVTADMIPETEWLAGHERPDIICAFAHWGRGGSSRPGPRTQARALKLAEKGVAIVAGHHQQRLQPIERIGGSHIAYGLGTFHAPAADRSVAQRLGAMLVVDISAGRERGRLAAYELFPFLRVPGSRGCRIVPVDALTMDLRAKADAVLADVAGQRP